MNTLNFFGSIHYYVFALGIFSVSFGTRSILAMSTSEASTSSTFKLQPWKWKQIPSDGNHLSDYKSSGIYCKRVGDGGTFFHYDRQVVLQAKVLQTLPGKEIISDGDGSKQENNPPTSSDGSPAMLWLKNDIDGVILKVTIVDLKNSLVIEEEALRPFCRSSVCYELEKDCNPDELLLSINAIIDNRLLRPSKPLESRKIESSSSNSGTADSNTTRYNFLSWLSSWIDFFKSYFAPEETQQHPNSKTNAQPV